MKYTEFNRIYLAYLASGFSAKKAYKKACKKVLGLVC